jgi:hypothetical protein
MKKDMTLAAWINLNAASTGDSVQDIISRLKVEDAVTVVVVDTNSNPADDRVRLAAIMADDESRPYYDTVWSWDGEKWNVWNRPYDTRPYAVRYREAYPTRKAEPVREAEPARFLGMGRKDGKCGRRSVRLACMS